MPMPRWWAKLNKRVFNPAELRRGKRPVLTHVGRNTGTIHRTPLDVHPVEGGYVFVLVYSSESDWVRNVLAAGRASIRIDGEDIELVNPRLVDEGEAMDAAPDARRPPAVLRISEYLRTDVAGR